MALEGAWDSLEALPTLGSRAYHLDILQMLWPLLVAAPGTPREED